MSGCNQRGRYTTASTGIHSCQRGCGHTDRIGNTGDAREVGSQSGPILVAGIWQRGVLNIILRTHQHQVPVTAQSPCTG